MPYRLAIFDFDGTLADSFPWFTRVVNDAADKFRFRRIEAHEIDGLRGKSAREMMQRQQVAAWKLPFIGRYVRQRKAQDLAGIPLFPETRETLAKLRATGVTIAIVSSNSEANIRAMLGPETAALVSYYECGASLFGKTRRFRAVLSDGGFTPGEALSIGDEIRDVEAARAAGIAFGAVAWGYTHMAALRALGPEAEFKTFGDIVAAFSEPSGA
jgi:phosphoglycolate phosphatase